MKRINNRLYEIIFEADTPAGKLFDVTLLIVILISVSLVMLESVPGIDARYHSQLKIMEWIITGIFTAEYILRILIVHKPLRYVFSFFGIIDFLSVIPTYLSLFVFGYQSLVVIRMLRLLRIFRILKLTLYTQAGRLLMRAMWARREKISVFIFFVLIIVVIMGTIMYLIEGETSGFKSIPLSIYWAIVTLTTVGYGDISPSTPLGQFMASIIMILGYAIIAVPTGIITSDMAGGRFRKRTKHLVCEECLYEGNPMNAQYCLKCGHKLRKETKDPEEKDKPPL